MVVANSVLLAITAYSMLRNDRVLTDAIETPMRLSEIIKTILKDFPESFAELEYVGFLEKKWRG